MVSVIPDILVERRIEFSVVYFTFPDSLALISPLSDLLIPFHNSLFSSTILFSA